MRSNPTAGLWIDDRYRGAHGIGRYAHEVISRLTVPWQSLGDEGAPANPLDFVRRLPGGTRGGLVYSPGYGALIRAERQILTVHDLIHLEVTWPGRAKYLAYYNGVVKPVIKRAGVVLTVSETSRRAIARWLDDDSVKVVNAGIGCSPAFTTEGAQNQFGALPYIVYVGNLRAHKNIVVVLDALGMLPDIELRVVLPASEMATATALIKTRRLTDRVRLLAGLSDSDLAELYRNAACSVFPSLMEGFGLPPLESVMCGTPVVYWEGCEAVAETVGPRGRAVTSAHDAREWAAQISAEVAAPTCFAIPRDSYRWETTAASIERLLVEQTSR